MFDFVFGPQPVFLGRADPSISLCPIFISQDSYGIRGWRKIDPPQSWLSSLSLYRQQVGWFS
jgi:hypothetical protein